MGRTAAAELNDEFGPERATFRKPAVWYEPDPETAWNITFWFVVGREAETYLPAASPISLRLEDW